MKILVMKFGGTSLATQEKRDMVADRILQTQKNGFQPVVVVSAIGREGDPYATDTLIKLAKQRARDINPRELDLLMSCGETISCVVLAATLKAKGGEGVVLTGRQAGIRTDQNYGDCRIQRINPERIWQIIAENKIPIIAGFQGEAENGDITTLGRGGSDTTAAAIGVVLKAHAVEIYTDVDGVMTADPRVVPDAVTLDALTYHDVLHFAQQGAKVIHPRAVEILTQHNIPLIVRNALNDKPGTYITHHIEKDHTVFDWHYRKRITGITSLFKRTQFRVPFEKRDSLLEKTLFERLTAENIELDMINVFPEEKAFVVGEEQEEIAAGIIREMGLTAHLQKGCAKISLIGAGIMDVPEMMAKSLAALQEKGIEVLQTSETHVSISFLVKKEKADDAVRALHDKFGLGKGGKS